VGFVPCSVLCCAVLVLGPDGMGIGHDHERAPATKDDDDYVQTITQKNTTNQTSQKHGLQLQHCAVWEEDAALAW
jgi:hypothetical protein